MAISSVTLNPGNWPPSPGFAPCAILISISLQLFRYLSVTPNLAEAKKFADAIHEKFPGKLLAYNCSPSFNWKKHLNDDEIASFQQEIAKMGYKFQFITLAGFHTQNIAIFELAEKYKKEGMSAYSRIQEQEFAREKDGYTSVKHQREVGTSYFDSVSNTISSGKSSTTAMAGSTESEQF